MTVNFIKKSIPSSLKARVRRLINTVVDFGDNRVLASLYTPDAADFESRYYSFSSQSLVTDGHDGLLPIPPSNMRMGYSLNSDSAFLERGENTASMIRSVWDEYGISITKDDAVLDFGCATSRVLRHFAKEAAVSEFWGADQDERSILWNKINLAPPFNFVTTTSYPHLPFEDQKFSFIYGISVFTHMQHLMDMWLMEFNRVLKTGGYALFTIMDENSAQVFKTQGEKVWNFRGADLNEALQYDFVAMKGIRWDETFSIYNSAWIRREWGRYFEVIEIRPRAEDNYQSAVVLKKG